MVPLSYAVLVNVVANEATGFLSSYWNLFDCSVLAMALVLFGIAATTDSPAPSRNLSLLLRIQSFIRVAFFLIRTQWHWMWANTDSVALDMG